jgi:hypothetical protein
MPSTQMFHTPLWATESPKRRVEAATAFMLTLHDDISIDRI